MLFETVVRQLILRARSAEKLTLKRPSHGTGAGETVATAVIADEAGDEAMPNFEMPAFDQQHEYPDFHCLVLI